jgi:hypothetical protein
VFIPFAFMTYRFSQREKFRHRRVDRGRGKARVVRGRAGGTAYLTFTYFVPIRNQPAG